jgi:hypothetical protein
VWLEQGIAFAIHQHMEVVDVKIMKLLAILFVMGLAGESARADRSYEINLSSISKIGDIELQPGQYKLVLDAHKVQLTHLDSGKTVELEAQIQEVETKSDRTQIHTQQVDGVSKASEIRIGGSKTRIKFN